MSGAMGAKLNVTGPSQGLYLVIAKTSRPDEIISRAGGKIAMRFTGEKLLAVLPFNGFMTLRADSRISKIGPVNLDTQRLKTLTNSLAKTVAAQQPVHF
ncbi:MAG: hypothetical protein MUC65_03400 [Pontiellaceae bacterium]|nr:hypothetical protein [Pontiellaceae bacterium]